MKKLSVFAAVSALALALAGCGSSAAPAASEANPVVGDWELTKVTATVPGGEPAEMNPEENASLFGDKGYYTFNEPMTVIPIPLPKHPAMNWLSPMTRAQTH